jgi:two-component system, LytTR family, response regulator LytT
MKKLPSNPYSHIVYWIIVILVLTLVFGRSWGNNTAAFFFIGMLLPIVLGASYFFNYVIVPKYLLTKSYVRFALYSLYTAVVSLYFVMIVLMFSFIYIGKFNFDNLGPNASDTILLAVILWLLILIGGLLLMLRQIKDNRLEIQQLLAEKNKWEKPYLEIMSNRKVAKIPYTEIVYIESLSDYIRINTITDQIVSKEKISTLASRLPDIFIRIHRSFIINKERIKNFSYDEVMVEDVNINIGRSYRKSVREALTDGNANSSRQGQAGFHRGPIRR